MNPIRYDKKLNKKRYERNNAIFAMKPNWNQVEALTNSPQIDEEFDYQYFEESIEPVIRFLSKHGPYLRHNGKIKYAHKYKVELDVAGGSAFVSSI